MDNNDDDLTLLEYGIVIEDIIERQDKMRVELDELREELDELDSVVYTRETRS